MAITSENDRSQSDALTEAIRPDRREYLLTEEAADLLRTPKATLYAWRHRGEGPPVRRVGRRLLYRRDELIAWVEARGVA